MASRKSNVEFEFREFTLPPTLSSNQVRNLLTEQAEYGKWELARHRIQIGGLRKVTLRRKIIRVRSTFDPEVAYQH